MRGTSIKQVTDFFKSTKSECQFSVLSFDKKTGYIVSAYGGYNFMDSFMEMTQKLANGYDVVLTDKEGWKEDMRITCAGERSTYEHMKKYSIKVSNFKIKKANEL